MEGFVRRIVAGGLALVAGLWVLTLGDGDPALVGGAAVCLLGVAALGAGVAGPLDPAW